MRSLKYFAVKSAVCLLAVNIVGVQSQWVWNKNLNADRGGSSGNRGNQGNNQGSFLNQYDNGGRDRDVTNDRFFVGQTSNNPSASKYQASGQSRLFPGAISAISNSIGNLANGGGGLGSLGGGGGGILGVLGSVPQFIAGLFSPGSGAGTLPEKLPENINPGSGGSSGGSNSGKSCDCFEVQECFLPFNQDGGQANCGGGKKMCCRPGGGGTRLLFEDQVRDRPVRNNRLVRQGLFREILRGSNQVVDDTLDLFLQPFLTEEDQQKIANRIIEQ